MNTPYIHSILFQPRTSTFRLFLCLLAICLPAAAHSAEYFVSREGSDANDGKTPQTPWRTVARVNFQSFSPGDVIRFRRDDRWREQLIPASGSPQGYVTYSAYGSGEKPLLLGSISKSRPEDWARQDDNIWATRQKIVAGCQLLANPSFLSGVSGWSLHTEGGASAVGSRDLSDYDSDPAGYRVQCTATGKSGSHIQLSTSPLNVVAGKLYRLVFRAKCTKPFVLDPPQLMRATSPWDNYSSGPRLRTNSVQEGWSTYTHYYHANVTAKDGRMTFFLGDNLPEGAVFRLDTLSLTECDGSGLLLADVGNIIFDGEKSCGVKVFDESQLDAQAEYWYDEQNSLVKLYSTECPASYYSDVECAIRKHIIDQSGKSYVIYENLALKYGAAHGIGGGNTHHVIVRDCDFAFIGGGDQFGGSRTVRYGNGVEFWGNAHDALVERCRLWEIYDAALTNQSNGPETQQLNITYRYNIIWNSEYSFEYWNRPQNSLTENVRFENNTCLNAGHGWGHAQRPDPSGRHLCLYTSTAKVKGLSVKNNIFFEAKTNAFYAPSWPKADLRALEMDHNCWYQEEGAMIAAGGAVYAMDEFSNYQSDFGIEMNSFIARPLLADPVSRDFHLTPDSPCIDAGMDVGFETDFEGKRVHVGEAPEVGALEFVEPPNK